LVERFKSWPMAGKVVALIAVVWFLLVLVGVVQALVSGDA
jgi:hypothetical protein